LEPSIFTIFVKFINCKDTFIESQVESGQLVDRAEKISKNVMIPWLCCTII